MSLTKLSLLLIGGGLLWIGAEYMEDRDRPSRHKVPAEAELSTVAGQLVESNSGGYTIGWIVVALGIAGLWLGRKSAS